MINNFIIYFFYLIAITLILIGILYFIKWIKEKNNYFFYNLLGKKDKYIEISALLITASFLIIYTIDTNKLRNISEEQLNLSKTQLLSSKEVYENTIEQLIENNKPVIIPKAFIDGNAIVLKNSSNFNAFNVEIIQYIGTGSIKCYIGFIDSKKQITNYYDLCKGVLNNIERLGGIGYTKEVCINYENANGLVFNTTGESSGYIIDGNKGNIVEKNSNIYDGIDYLDDYYEIQKEHESQFGQMGRLGKFEKINVSRGKCK